MDAQARSSGVSSCSGTQQVQDSRCFRARASSFNYRCRPRRLRCVALERVDTASQITQIGLRQQAERTLGARRDVEATVRTYTSHEEQPSSSIAASVPVAVLSGVAVLGLLSLLVPGDANAAEVLPLDLFSQFLVRTHGVCIDF